MLFFSNVPQIKKYMSVSVSFSTVTCDLYLQFIDLSFYGLHFHYSKITYSKNLVIFYKTHLWNLKMNRLIYYHTFFLLFSLNNLPQIYCFNQFVNLHIYTHLKVPNFFQYTLCLDVETSLQKTCTSIICTSKKKQQQPTHEVFKLS